MSRRVCLCALGALGAGMQTVWVNRGHHAWDHVEKPHHVVANLTELVALHLRFHTYAMGWTDSAVRRYVRDAGPLLQELNVLTRCDCTTRNEKKALMLSRRMDDLEARIADLAAHEELAAIRPELDGAEVMAQLGVSPGPVVGKALAFLLEIRLDEGLLGDDEIRSRLNSWWLTEHKE